MGMGLIRFLILVHATFTMGVSTVITVEYLRRAWGGELLGRHIAAISTSYMLLTLGGGHYLWQGSVVAWKVAILFLAFALGDYALFQILKYKRVREEINKVLKEGERR